MNILKINDHVPVANKGINILRLVLSIVFAIGFFVYARNSYLAFSFIINIWPFVIAFCCYGCCGIAYDAYRYNKGKEVFREKLHEIDLSNLISLSSSPEMTTGEREVIIHHLNSKHPGWSLAQRSA